MEIETKQIKTFDILIDSNGNGSIEFPANGYLELVVLPTMITNPSVKIYYRTVPEIVAFDLKDQEHKPVYYPRIQIHDIEGKLVDGFEKIFLTGDAVIEVKSAVPDSSFKVVLVV